MAGTVLVRSIDLPVCPAVAGRRSPFMSSGTQRAGEHAAAPATGSPGQWRGSMDPMSGSWHAAATHAVPPGFFDLAGGSKLARIHMRGCLFGTDEFDWIVSIYPCHRLVLISCPCR
jgi:hypothetical protein